jgi:hypothetical protein
METISEGGCGRAIAHEHVWAMRTANSLKPFCLLIIAACCFGEAAAACKAPKLIGPNAGSLTERQPRLTWQTVPGATGYRVRLQSRVPDGGVIAAHDTVVSAPDFLPPRPLAEHRAKVTVRLSAMCGSETSAESISSFVIDTSALCRLGELDAALESGKASLKWRPVAGARSYEVRAYRLLDGRLLASQETREAAAQLSLAEAAVLSVRPACSDAVGEAVYRVVVAR